MAVCSRYVLTLSQKVGRHLCKTTAAASDDAAAGNDAENPSSVVVAADGEEADRRQPSCATMRQATHFNR